MRILGLLTMLLASMASYGSTPAFCEQHNNVAAIPNPVMFVTMVPIPSDFGTLASTFDNHDANMRETARGGDLMIRHPSGLVCNLTREAGFGNDGFQGTNAITVRDPAVHYSGEKAVFSMVIGAPSQQYQLGSYYWQLYEVTGLGLNEPVVITQVVNQPANYNNVGPVYGSDDRIIFSSDRPRGGQRHLWPQHDEYESSPTPTGLWSLNPQSGSLKLLQHSPSGSFDPIIDSFGRIIYTRWDHLMRDQQAAADAAGSSRDFGTFDYADESESAATTSNRQEYFPEPLEGHVPEGSNLVGSRLNHFFPWEINQDGTSEETLNHLGRHELHRFFQKA